MAKYAIKIDVNVIEMPRRKFFEMFKLKLKFGRFNSSIALVEATKINAMDGNDMRRLNSGANNIIDGTRNPPAENASIKISDVFNFPGGISAIKSAAMMRGNDPVMYDVKISNV